METQERRCTAKAKSTGGRCKRPPIAGGTVCRVHGGAAPQVKKKALERLKELQDPAIKRLADLLDDATVIDGGMTEDGPIRIPLITGNPNVILGAAKTVLDRTGLSEGRKVEHTGKDGGPIHTTSTDLDLSALSDEELRTLALIRSKIAERGGDPEGATEA